MEVLQVGELANSRILFFILIFASTGSRSQFAIYDDLQPISMELSDQSCTFPSRWAGNWFQSGVIPTITINHTRISSKGRCVEADGDKFIVYSQTDECYRCVVFHETHLNALQYKETLCYADLRGISLQDLCRRIVGDAHLYSMFRLESDPIPCPFHGSFTFTYSRGQGVCHSPVSTIDTCIKESQLVLNYQACYDVHGTESMVEELECIAQWKDSSTRYMVALKNYQYDPSSYEERFRCYAYEFGPGYSSSGSPFAEGYTMRRRTNFSSSSRGGGSPQLYEVEDAEKVIFRVAQSGDATCLGLSPTDGAKMLSLRRGVPLRTCEFPKWLQAHTQWLTLDGRVSYTFENSTLRIKNISGTDDDDDVLVTVAVCIREVDQNQLDMDRKRSFILRSTTGCEIGYACLHVYKRDAQILELQLGKVGRDVEAACHSYNFNQDLVPYVTLTSPTPEIRECPYTGVFDITDMTAVSARRCRQEFKGSVQMGCTGLDSVHMNMYCPNTQKVHEEYTCNGWWEDGGDTFLIVSSTTKEETDRFCFRIHEKVLELSPQELRRREMKVIDYDSSSGENEINTRRGSYGTQKMFNFIKYRSSCQRKGFITSPGSHTQLSISFNTTNYGECDGEGNTGNWITVQIFQTLFILLLGRIFT